MIIKKKYKIRLFSKTKKYIKYNRFKNLKIYYINRCNLHLNKNKMKI